MSAEAAKRSALIIASDEYADLRLRRLRAPVRDAEELARVLSDPAIGNFDVDVVLNQPEYKVRRKLSEFFADRGRDDLLLAHFSCHGLKDDDGNLYFATPDSELEHLDSTAVSSEFVNRQMRRSRSRRIALFLDCCYSGAFSRGAVARAGDGLELAERFDGQGQVVITASNSTEYAFEGDELTGGGTPSVFTTALVEGLDSGEADRDCDGLVSIDELYDFVYDRVRERTPSQTPSKWTYDLQGELYIARNRNPRPIEPAELPLDLREAIENRLAFVRAGAVGELGLLLAGSNKRLAAAARVALDALTLDDSRSVSDAAASALAGRAAPGRPELSQPPTHTPPPPPSDRAPEAVAEEPAARIAPAIIVPEREGDEVPPIVTLPGKATWRTALAVRAGRNWRRWLPALLALAGAVVLLAGWARIDDRGFKVRFSAIGVAVPILVAAAAVVLLRVPRRRSIASGLLLGFGLQRLGLSFDSPNDYEYALRGTDGERVLLVAGSVAVAVAGVFALVVPAAGDARGERIARPGWKAPILALLGTALCVAGLAVPWSYSSESGQQLTLLGEERSALGRLGLLLGIACMVAAAGLLLRRHVRRPLLLAGALVALGAQAALYFAVLGWHIKSLYDLDFRRGTAIGIAGGVLVLIAGLLTLRSVSRPASTA